MDVDTKLAHNKLNTTNNADSISPNKHLQDDNLEKRYDSEHNNSDKEVPDEVDFLEFLKMGPIR